MHWNERKWEELSAEYLGFKTLLIYNRPNPLLHLMLSAQILSGTPKNAASREKEKFELT